MGFHWAIQVHQSEHKHHHNQLELLYIAYHQSCKLLEELQFLAQYQHSTASRQNLLHMLQICHLMYLEKLNFHQLKERLHSMVFYIELAKLLFALLGPKQEDSQLLQHQP